MVNLIENAISFSPPRGQVSIKARRRGSEVEVTIEDEGPGIARENLERIFERFYTDRPHETFGQNSGLGLNISRQIIAAHGGRLYAENRPLTESEAGQRDSARKRSGGARFVMRLAAA